MSFAFWGIWQGVFTDIRYLAGKVLGNTWHTFAVFVVNSVISNKESLVGNRLEMFAREAPDGWDVWGNMA